MKPTSVGTIITDGERFLACHSTGNSFYDLPKGMPEAGEEPIDACCRETKEETGIVLDPSRLRDLGVRDYLRNKKLHLFLWMTRELPDIGGLTCTSFFEHYRSGKRIPEVDGYRYLAFREAGERMTANMAGVIARIAEEYGLGGAK